MTTTPEQFLALLTGSQEERDAAEPVAPEDGKIALLRNGKWIGPLKLHRIFGTDSVRFEAVGMRYGWFNTGQRVQLIGHPDRGEDIIATLDLASVLAELVASRARIKELERGVLNGLSQWGQDHQGVDG